jgi:hypothetical protein
MFSFFDIIFFLWVFTIPLIIAIFLVNHSSLNNTLKYFQPWCPCTRNIGVYNCERSRLRPLQIFSEINQMKQL